nr:putative wall-associated receptor kinase-like 16 [Ipomoea batatas]GME09156.1 putative wall-associated receptor kinase-like 16 [Ipomoea batatas]
MSCFLVLLLLVLWAILGCFAPTATSKTNNSSIAKPNCDDHCGNVSIPFPFGLTKECALNSNFSIICNTSYNPPKPFLSSTVEVRDISVKGQLRVMKLVDQICYKKGENRSSVRLSFTSSRFYVNQTANKFVAVGCDTFANVYAFGNDGAYKTGSNCIAICNSTHNVTNGTCSGIGCCETGIPNVARNVYHSLDSLYYYNNTAGDINKCSYAFVVQKEEFSFSSTMLTRTWDIETVPMVLDWTISNQTCVTACQGNTTCVAVNDEGYRCGCKEGYQGNPYLSGCQDIDECEDGKYNCSKNSICSNTDGGYECPCKKGYHGNGKDDLGCISYNHRLVMLVLGIALGTITLLISGCCLYLGYRWRKSILMKEKFFRENGGLVLQQKIAQEEERNLSLHFLSSLKENRLLRIFDDNIVCEGNTEELIEVSLLAERCLNVKGEDRPTMKEVAMELSGLMRTSKHPWVNNSEITMESEALLIEPSIPLRYDATFNTTVYDSLKHDMEFSVAAGR